MTDVWVCSNCKSINRLRDSRCYSCGQRQEEVAVATEHTPNVRLAEAVANRAARGYQSSTAFAIAAGVLIISTAALGLWLLVQGLRDVDPLRIALANAIRTGNDAAVNAVIAADDARLATATSLWWLCLGLAVLAFGLWLSRVRLNIPALGGGTPTWGPWKAFLYPLIPIVNLVRVPGMINDALYRLDPRAGGLAMVALAWVGFVGSRIVWLVGTIAISTGFAGAIVGAGSLEEVVVAANRLVDQTVILSVITEVMTATGAVLLVALIARIEMRAMDRDEEIRAQLGPAPVVDAASPATGDAPPPAPVAVSAPMPAAAVDSATNRPAATPIPGARPLTISRPFADAEGASPAPAPAAPVPDDGPLAPPPPPPPG